MSILKKICASVLVLSMVLALAACGNEGKESTSSKQSQSVAESKTQESQEESSSKATEPAEREHVELSLYNYASILPGNEETFEAVNKYLKEKLNTTIDFHIYKSSEYSSTVGTMISSGAENMDIIFTRSGMVDFQTYVAMNAFAPLEDYKDEYLTGTQAVSSEAHWDALTVKGHLYAVPTPRDSATRYCVYVNTTLLEDLGLTFPEEYHTFFDLVDFLYEAKAARDKKYPEKAKQPIVKNFGTAFEGWYNLESIGSGIYANVPGLSGIEGMGEGETVFCPYLTDEYREWAKLRAQLVKDCIIPFDEKTFDPDKVLYNAGEMIMDWSVGTVYRDEDTNMPYFKIKFVPAQDSVHATSGLTAGYAVSAKSKNIERALEVIDLINSDEYLATLLRFGPEGIGWTDEDNDGMVEFPALNADATNRYYYQWYAWQLGGLTVTKVPPASTTEFATLLSEMNDNATPAANLGFVFDKTPVQNEVAACANVISEYHTGALQLGQNENVDQLCDEFIKKLKDNGIEKIVAECQKQLDTWRAANGK